MYCFVYTYILVHYSNIMVSQITEFDSEGFDSEQHEIDDIDGALADLCEAWDDFDVSEEEQTKMANAYYAKRMREIKRKWRNIA